MPYVGLDPELSRELSLLLRQAGTLTEDLASQVTLALALSELESSVPARMGFLSEDLDDVGVIVSARVDIAEGLVIDNALLAEELGLTAEQIDEILAVFADPETNAKAETPFFDLIRRAEQGGEIIRASFLGLPPPGQDLVLDEALEELGLLLPDALLASELDVTTLTAAQQRALQVLTDALGLSAGTSEAFAAFEVRKRFDIDIDSTFEAQINFAALAQAFELDQRLGAAAGLPTMEDIIYQANRDGADIGDLDHFLPLDAFLPALLVFEGEAPIDPEQRALTVAFAQQVGFRGTGFDAALDFLRARRVLQRSLIPGDFEGVEGPLLVWTEEGVNQAILAGERAGVLDPETRAQIERFAEAVLAGDGSGAPIELSDAEIQALAIAVAGQNGEDFLENPQIQRQIISAINLIGRQATLDDQRRLFADSIEAFRTLATVGAPALTIRQLEAAVGPEVSHELSRKYLRARSAKAVGKRPQFLTLLNHWGIPGGDTIKTKKRKFSFSFDESGQLTRVRNKKISKWKRFKNSLKAMWKALKQEWKDNPWGVIWEGVKIAAAVVLTVVPGTNAIGAALLYASLAVLAADTVIQAAQGNWMEALASGLSVATYGASSLGNVAQVGSTAHTVNKVASTGQKILAVVQHGEDFVDAVEDGDILGAISSGAGGLAAGARAFPGADAVGSTANVIATGADFVASTANAVGAGIDVVDAIDDGDFGRILSSSFTLVSASLDAANKGGQFANSASAYGAGTVADPTQIDLQGGTISDGIRQDLEDEYTNRVFSSDTLNAFSSYAETAADLAQVTNVGISVSDGDYIGALQQGVQFIGSETTDEQTQLALAVADKGLAVAQMVETVYRGGSVDGGDVFNALFELGAAAGAAFAGPAEPEAAPEPVITQLADGSMLIDYNADGIDDALLSADDARRGVVQIDLDGDGDFDVSYTDTDGDGQTDLDSGQLRQQEINAAIAAGDRAALADLEVTEAEYRAGVGVLRGLSLPDELLGDDIVLANAGVSPPLPSPARPGDEVDWGFIADREGGQLTDGYVPSTNAQPGPDPSSGVTVATGFDVGQRSASDIDNLPIDQALKNKLKPYAGLEGQAAANALAQQPLQLTRAEANQLDQVVKGAILDQVIANYDRDLSPGATPFLGLPPEAQTVIASVAFNYGPGLDRVTPAFWKHVTEQNWFDALGELRNFGNPALQARRDLEGDLLEQIINPGLHEPTP